MTWAIVSWLFCFLFFMVPLAWTVGRAVDMERASWPRGFVFALCEAVVSGVGCWLLQVDLLLLRLAAGTVGALFLSPLFFWLVMTRHVGRACLGSFVLIVFSTGSVTLLFVG